jgi:hypothetical protein
VCSVCLYAPLLSLNRADPNEQPAGHSQRCINRSEASPTHTCACADASPARHRAALDTTATSSSWHAHVTLVHLFSTAQRSSWHAHVTLVHLVSTAQRSSWHAHMTLVHLVSTACTRDTCALGQHSTAQLLACTRDTFALGQHSTVLWPRT